MSWYKFAKKEFSYNSELRDLWRQLIKDEMDRVSISFDLENNDIVSSKTINLDIQDDKRSDTEFKVFSEMYAAGGDWECPNVYFRCQIFTKTDYYHNVKKKKIRGQWAPDMKFVYIPTDNLNLIKSKNSYQASTNQEECNWVEDVGEKHFWDDLKTESEKRYLNHLDTIRKSDSHDQSSWSSGFVRNLLTNREDMY